MPDLPRDARARLAALEDACPEAAEIWRRLYPSDERDQRAREVAEAERTARAQQEQRNREELCRRCIDGDFGKEAASAARLVLEEAGGELTSMAVNRIVGAVQKAQRDQRFAKKPEGRK